METTEKKKSPLGVAAAVPFAILWVQQLSIYYEDVLSFAFFRVPALFPALLSFLIPLVISVLLALRVHNVALPVAFAGFALLKLRNLIMFGMSAGRVDYMTLFSVLTAVILCTIMFLNLTEKAKKLWFIPGIIISLYAVVTVLPELPHVGIVISYYDPEYWPIWLWYEICHPIVFALGVWLAGRWFAYPNSPDTAYRSMLPHILLLLFTFGIYYLYWIYKSTDYLNCVEGEEPRNPTTKLLLCIFVPFYSFYWIYKSAQRIDRLASAKGISSNLTTLCLILAIFVGVIPPMLMQDKINAIITAENESGQYQPTTSHQSASSHPSGRLGVANELKTFKELLDSGVITQEEFDEKKKQLLGL
ncbi:DUF4234 domain-containing protein [Pseudoflavonifractor sp. 524-17]|uniref:DUF4234 domain-containing protein n=1 Tax=Pseudoflavonifractor sp. 524-17 TaxID=2304577 RepID=UPI001FACE2CA|nr:DUF4234 domain-containing protein [Pseudoflavonifractor sp. 524-17]